MAGTLTISTLSDGTNSTSSTNCIQGSAKAWAQFGGGTTYTAGAIQGSYNVSSVTVNGTGDYTVNFTTAMSNTAYAAMATASPNGGSSVIYTNVFTDGSTNFVAPTTAGFRMFIKQTSFATSNNQLVNVAVFR